MASPEDVDRASEFAFRLFQIPSAMWHGAGTAFSQSMPLSTQTFSDVFVFTQLYVVAALIVFSLLFFDAGVKIVKMVRLMLLGRLRPWSCVRRFMGFTEVSQDSGAEHDDVLCINVPLTGYMLQIITMYALDVFVAFPLAIFWITWVPLLLGMTIMSWRQPKHYYTHLQSIRGRYAGIPHRASENPFDTDDEDANPDLEDIEPEKENGHPTDRHSERGSTKSGDAMELRLESEDQAIQFGLRNMNLEEYAEYQEMPIVAEDPATHTTPFVLPNEEHEGGEDDET